MNLFLTALVVVPHGQGLYILRKTRYRARIFVVNLESLQYARTWNRRETESRVLISRDDRSDVVERINRMSSTSTRGHTFFF